MLPRSHHAVSPKFQGPRRDRRLGGSWGSIWLCWREVSSGAGVPCGGKSAPTWLCLSEGRAACWVQRVFRRKRDDRRGPTGTASVLSPAWFSLLTHLVEASEA